MEASEVIERLGLKRLPAEGGFYREIYRSAGVIPDEALPVHDGARAYTTSIYYLITPEDFSTLHKVKSDEIFHFYRGDPVEMIQIDASGLLEGIVLGPRFEDGHQPQTLVPSGVWQGTRLVEGGKWALMGCTVAPGFERADFETKSRAELVRELPQHRDIIARYTVDPAQQYDRRGSRR